MNPVLAGLVHRHDGVVTRADALAVVCPHVLDHAVARGDLVRVLPRVYVPARLVGDPALRHRAALAYGGPGSVLGHVSSLKVWWPAAPVPDSDLHLVVPPARRLRTGTGVVVHRCVLDPSDVVSRDGLRVTRFERALVDSWALLPDEYRRASVIGAVADRRTTPERLEAELARVPNLRGRPALAGLLDQLTTGCRSELELWGCRHVFRGRGFERLEWQVPMRLAGRTVYLDAFDRAARVAFELDGAAWHTSPGDRARDVRRDAALAALGITTVRYTYARLRAEPDVVRAEALMILRVHRRAMGALPHSDCRSVG